MLQIKRYCGRERLPGGERRWRRLARAVGFEGRVEVFGYGVGGRPGAQQRRAANTGSGNGKGTTLADFEPGLIRVWLPCSCAVVEYKKQKWFDRPLPSFAHELGHHIQHSRGRKHNEQHETVAERYGRMLLRNVN